MKNRLNITQKNQAELKNSLIQSAKFNREKLLETLKNHTVYKNLETIQDLRLFMESHVFAVWDFMSLLKSLQVELAGLSIPWLPKENTVLTRFINEIVLVEESDLDEQEQPKSHFIMYTEAMKEIGAETSKINSLLKMIHKNISIKQALDKIDIDQRIKDFVKFSFEVITTKKSHLIASAFTYGREDVIPEIFIKIVEELDPKNTLYSKLKFYLNRHIEVDGETHGPIALEMMHELCGEDLEKWTEALRIGERALEHRIELWNAINENILAQKKYLKTLPVHRYATSV